MKEFTIKKGSGYVGAVPGLECSWKYELRDGEKVWNTLEFFFEGDPMETAMHHKLFERVRDCGGALTGNVEFCGYFEEHDTFEHGTVYSYRGPKAVRAKIEQNAKDNERIAAFCKEHGFNGTERYINWSAVARLE